VPDLPVWWANVATVLGFIVLGVLVFLIPRSRETDDGHRRRWFQDLRWWAIALIAIQLGIYTVFT
jgi:hypothetical protein